MLTNVTAAPDWRMCVCKKHARIWGVRSSLASAKEVWYGPVFLDYKAML